MDVRDEGRKRLYRLDGHALKPIHNWVKANERSWSERFERLDDVLEDLKRKEQGDDGSGEGIPAIEVVCLAVLAAIAHDRREEIRSLATRVLR